MFTKHFFNKDKWESICSLIGVVPSTFIHYKCTKMAPGAKAPVSLCAPFPSSTDARRHHPWRAPRWPLSNIHRPPKAAQLCSHCCSTTPQSAFTPLVRRQDIWVGECIANVIMEFGLTDATSCNITGGAIAEYPTWGTCEGRARTWRNRLGHFLRPWFKCAEHRARSRDSEVHYHRSILGQRADDA